MRLSELSLLSFCVLALLTGCGGQMDEPTEVTYQPGTELPEGIDVFHVWSERVAYGSRPQGEIAYRNLRALGYRTVVSVESELPDAAAAGVWRLRTVHVPLVRGAIDRDAALKIAYAAHITDGGIYVYDEVGGAGAAIAALIARRAVDGLSAPAATEAYRALGFKDAHPRLEASLLAFEPPTPEAWTKMSIQLPEGVSPRPLTRLMLGIEKRHDALKAASANGWGLSDVHSGNPALAKTANELGDSIESVARQPLPEKKQDLYGRFIREGAAAARLIALALQRGQANRAQMELVRLTQTCALCHQDFRR